MSTQLELLSLSEKGKKIAREKDGRGRKEAKNTSPWSLMPICHWLWQMNPKKLD